MEPEILYQDRAVVVAVKPCGVLSEGTADTAESMPGLLAPTCGTVYPVHRLDRVVGGVMVYAKNRGDAAALCATMANGGLKKTYVAVVTGAVTPSKGEWRDYLFKDSAKNKSFVVTGARRGAKEAVLRYRVLDCIRREDETYSRVEIELVTGRSHQIRVQFASRGYPLVGDGKYGSRIKAKSVALFARSLAFPHPESGQLMQYSAPAPSVFPFDLFGSSGLEIEYKYLIAYPDLALLEQIAGVRKKQIRQTYLGAGEGETRRVRLVTEGDAVRYFYTRKLRQTHLRAIEEEAEIDEKTFSQYLCDRDLSRATIEKTRYCIPYAGQTIEVDVYPFWQDRAIAEVEVAEESTVPTLPSFIKVIKDVTYDRRYKNVNLALAIPQEL